MGATLPKSTTTWREWHVPLSSDDVTLKKALASAEHIMADQEDVPLIVQLIENPKFHFPLVDLFSGAVGIQQHDCIHVVLGRGLLPKDEAFIIGFTMGSTNRVSATEEKLYSLASKYLYPGPYKFNDDEVQIFKDAVRLGYVSDCQPLDQIDFSQYLDYTIKDLRKALGVEELLLKAYYEIELKRHPSDPASSRLLN